LSDGRQKPWQGVKDGKLQINLPWNYTVGYNFTPQKDGKVLSLGGYFNGTRTVKIWNKATGALLAQAVVSSANNWSYATCPSGGGEGRTVYTVAYYSQGQGMSYRYLGSSTYLPKPSATSGLWDRPMKPGIRATGLPAVRSRTDAGPGGCDIHGGLRDHKLNHVETSGPLLGERPFS